MNLMNNFAEFMSRGTLIKLRKAKDSQNMSQIMYGYVFFPLFLSLFFSFFMKFDDTMVFYMQDTIYVWLV